MGSASSNNFAKLVRRATGASLVKSKHIGFGKINQIHELTLDSGESLMLRMFSEPWKARKEAYLYQRLTNETSVPIPKVILSEDSTKTLGKPFILLTKIPGEHLDSAYRKNGNLALFEKAGANLAKIHSISFDKFGWIVGEEIRPAFKKWEDFALYDLGYKLGRLRDDAEMRKLRQPILNFFDAHMSLLDISSKPCLLHKDLTPQHILSDGLAITGFIDWEWATAGHAELDFVKLEQGLFTRIPESRQAFLKGYRSIGKLTAQYDERMRLYRLWNFVNLANISQETKDMKTLAKTFRDLKAYLKTCV